MARFSILPVAYSLILFCVINTFTVQAQITSWQWLSPYPQGNTLNDIYMVDANFVYAVGTNGTIVSSTNGGDFWRVKSVVNGFTGALNAVNFYDASFGIVVGDSGTIMKTSNGGESWDEIVSGTLLPFRNIAHIDHSSWLISSTTGQLLKSTDAGDHWAFVSSPAGHTYAGGIAILSDSNWIVVGNGIYQTLDGGNNWIQRMATVGNSVTFFNRSLGLVLGGGIQRTTDGGITWNPASVSGTPPLNAAFFDSLHAIATGYYFNPRGGGSTFFRSSDGGLTWTGPGSTGTDAAIRGVAARGSRGLIAGDAGMIMVSINGGTSWTKQTYGPTVPLTTLAFADPYLGIVAGVRPGTNGGNFIFRTTNGGVDWTDLSGSFPTGFMLGKCQFVDSQYCIGVGGIVSSSGTYLFISGNQGTSWSYLAVTPTGFYPDLYFTDRNHGWVAGNGIVYTSNGGSTWTTQLAGYTINSITFTSPTNGYAVGENGVVFRTTNGTSWSPQNSLTTHALKDVSFFNDNMGIAVGRAYPDGHAIIIRTFTGGASWFPMLTNIPYDLNAVSMLENGSGLAVGNHGTVIYTTSAGNIWSTQVFPSQNNCSDVVLVKNNTLAYLSSKAPRSRLACSVGMLQSISETPDPTAYVIGTNGMIIAAGISPLHLKTWTGAVDTNWNNSGNWSPSGVPIPGDSVVVPSSVTKPVIYQAQQQITISTLTIQSGGKLTITDSLRRFTVMGDVRIFGTLEVRSPANTTIIVGGNWIVSPGGSMMRKGVSGTDQGFLPALSTVYFTGTGTCEETFYNVVFDTASGITSGGNIIVKNQCSLFNDLNLRVQDTLYIEDTAPDALSGQGMIADGTIRRGIAAGELRQYRFESTGTFVQFDGTGSYPSALTVTTLPAADVPDAGLDWVVVGGTVDTTGNTVIADTIHHLSKWRLGIPRISSSLGTIGVKREYLITPEGGSAYSASLQLRYDQSELLSGIPEGEMKLMTGPWYNDTLPAGWNIIGVPLIPENNQVSVLFPDASSHAFEFIGTYNSVTALQYGKGYWLKYPPDKNISILGDDIRSCVIPVTPGWNLIGSMSYPVVASGSIMSLPPDIIASKFFGWNKRYFVSDSIMPLHGYWVRTTTAGSIILSSDSNVITQSIKGIESTGRNGWNILFIRDAGTGEGQLLFGEASGKVIDPSFYELPPLPPEGCMDVRYGTGRILENTSLHDWRTIPLNFTGAQYPIIIRWQFADTGSHAATSMLIGEKEISMDAACGQVEVTDPGARICLVLSPSDRIIPNDFNLGTNYPNPFNPLTTIQYQLPVESQVELRVYNIIGEQVAVLIHGVQTAGIRTYAWNARDYPSGVYYYRLSAVSSVDPGRKYDAVRRMILIK